MKDLPITRTNVIKAIEAPIVWDVLVIGGGASGLGSALEATTRGYKTLLLEAHDYAKGTSSRSTKLVHGGVRYLAQGNIALVREALHERGIMKKNAPHLVHDLGFLIASYHWWTAPFYGLGLKVYDFLAGKLNLKASHLVNKAEALALTPTLKQDNLKGGVHYFDGQFDDSRLAITLLRTLQKQGGYALNHAPVTGFIQENGKIVGAVMRDNETGHEYEIRARSVINATGVFVDDVRRMEDPNAKAMLSPSQGVHVVVDRKFLPGDCAIMVPQTEDGRILFAIPWHNHVVIGTTDTPVPNTSLEPKALPEEIDFILRTAAEFLVSAPTKKDVLSVFTGLRPLVKASEHKETKKISRSHVIRTSSGGLITLTGGKWTTYRRMGDETVDQLEKNAGLAKRASQTEALKLHGWTQENIQGHWKVYGTDESEIKQIYGSDVLLHPALPYTEAEVRWAVRMEQAMTVEDVLARRMRALFLNAKASQEVAGRVAEIMAEELNKDKQWQTQQVGAFKELARGYLIV